MRKLLLFLLLAVPLGAQTRYVDFSAGSDQWDGTAKTHTSGTVGPWKSSPYMSNNGNCSDNSGAHFGYSHTAGQQIIFKGGVSWPAACFTMGITAGGNSGTPDYYGVDVTWFTGGSFTRPLFDLNFQIPSGNTVISVSSGLQYITIDNIEITHQGISVAASASCSGGTVQAYESQAAITFFNGGSTTPVGLVVKNAFIHDWVAPNVTVSSPQGINYSAGGIFGPSLVDSTEISGENSYYGAGHTPMRFGGAVEQTSANGGTVLSNSKIHGTMAAAFNQSIAHDNEFYHISGDVNNFLDPCVHTQVIEADGGSPMTVYNNLLHDNGRPSGTNNAGVIMLVCPGSNVFNNVGWANNDSGSSNGPIQISSAFCFGSASGAGSVGNFYNNTFDCSSGVPCVRALGGGSGYGTINLQNNIWVTNGSPLAIQTTIPTFNQTPNSTLSTATATADGYTIANKYKGAGAGTGLNLTSSCSGSLTALCSDTQGATWFNGSYVARPNSAWDLGAYQSGGAAVMPPAVAITAPTANSTVSGASVTLTATCAPNGGHTITSIQFQIDGANFGAAGNSSPYSPTAFDSTKASNANHSIAAVCTDSAALQTTVSETVTVSNSIPGCFVTDVPFTQNISFPAITGNSATVTWTGQPFASGTEDTVMGLSNGPAASYNDLATSVRFSNDGKIEVYDQAACGTNCYRADNPVTYAGGTTYTIQKVLNFSTHMYSATETAPVNTVLCASCAFRTSQNAITQVTTLNGESSAPTPVTAKICSVATAPVVAVAPSPANFGSVTQSTTSPVLTVTVSNTGGAAETLNTPYFTITGANAADFTNTGAGTCTNGGTVAGGASCTATLTFTPLTTSAETATLNISGTANGSTVLNGTGLAIPTQPAPSAPAAILSYLSNGNLLLTIKNAPKCAASCSVMLSCQSGCKPTYGVTIQ